MANITISDLHPTYTNSQKLINLSEKQQNKVLGGEANDVVVKIHGFEVWRWKTELIDATVNITFTD